MYTGHLNPNGPKKLNFKKQDADIHRFENKTSLFTLLNEKILKLVMKLQI